MYKIFIFLLVVTCSVFSPTVSDAQRNSSAVVGDTIAINEASLLKDRQQQIIDSLIKTQLQGELLKAAGNTRKTQELEEKLQEIAVADSLRNIRQKDKILLLKKNARGYPVILNLDTLFEVFTRIGSFSPAERAAAVSAKIEKLYEDPFYNADSVRIVKNEDGYDLIYKTGSVLVSVSNLDALWFGKPTKQLASTYLQVIKTSIAKEREAHSLMNWLKRIGLVMAIIVLLVLIVALINRLFKRLETFIIANKEKYLAVLRLRRIKLITAEHFLHVLIRLNAVLKILIIGLLIYFSLPLLFSVFPETEAWTGTLLKWVLSPLKAALLGIVDYLPNLFKVLVIYFIFKYIIRAVGYFFNEVKTGNIQFKGFHADWAIPTFNILRFVLYAFMLVLVFPFLPGSGSPAFQGVSVFLGILISLGSSSAITNIVAGLVITYMRPFRVGDRVKIGEIVGDVVEKTMLVIRIKTIKNEDITVPNSMVLSSSTINYSSHAKAEKQGLIVHYTVTIGYDVPWKKVYELLITSALKTRYILEDPKPFVLQISLDDFYISYQINAYTNEANMQALIYSNLLENIQDTFNTAGIDILSPGYQHVVVEKEKEVE
jgi:small-conductance mechanosensitive channel